MKSSITILAFVIITMIYSICDICIYYNGGFPSNYVLVLNLIIYFERKFINVCILFKWSLRNIFSSEQLEITFRSWVDKVHRSSSAACYSYLSLNRKNGVRKYSFFIALLLLNEIMNKFWVFACIHRTSWSIWYGKKSLFIKNLLIWKILFDLRLN